MVYSNVKSNAQNSQMLLLCDMNVKFYYILLQNIVKNQI